MRRALVNDASDLDASWIVMEDDETPGDNTTKFLALATHPATTHVFLIWPRDCKMVGTEDELVMWQAIRELRGRAPECYVFHQSGVLEVANRNGERQVMMKDPQGKSPYLLDILRRGVFEQEWTDEADLRRQIRMVLKADLGVAAKRAPASS